MSDEFEFGSKEAASVLQRVPLFKPENGQHYRVVLASYKLDESGRLDLSRMPSIVAKDRAYDKDLRYILKADGVSSDAYLPLGLEFKKHYITVILAAKESDLKINRNAWSVYLWPFGQKVFGQLASILEEYKPDESHFKVKQLDSQYKNMEITNSKGGILHGLKTQEPKIFSDLEKQILELKPKLVETLGKAMTPAEIIAKRSQGDLNLGGEASPAARPAPKANFDIDSQIDDLLA